MFWLFIVPKYMYTISTIETEIIVKYDPCLAQFRNILLPFLYRTFKSGGTKTTGNKIEFYFYGHWVCVLINYIRVIFNGD